MGWIHFSRDIGIRGTEMLGAVGHACYIHREKGFDQTDGQAFDWTAKTDLYESQMIVGEGAGGWVSECADKQDFVGFWEQYENFENEYLEQRYARQDWEIIEEHKAKAPIYFRETIALPIELTSEQNSDLIKEFVSRAYTSHGITVQLAIHTDEGNPHAHIMGTVRRQTETGLGARFDDFGRYGDRKRRLNEVRGLYASIGNQHLSKHGFEPRLDHRSYAEQGVPFEPTVHEGWNARAMFANGRPARIIHENEETKLRNAEIAKRLPASIIQELSATRATFTESDLKGALFKRVNGDDELYQAAASKMLAHESLVHAGQDLRGQDRYTTADYLNAEKETLASAVSLSQCLDGHALNVAKLDKRIAQKYTFLSTEQRAALHHIAASGGLAFIQGRAGAGKTTIMKILAEEYAAQGYRVQGFALAGAAADNLERETGIPSRTIDMHIHQLSRIKEIERELLELSVNQENPEQQLLHQKKQATLERLREATHFTNRDVLIVDEGGMVGTKHYRHILEKADEAGAKIVVIGDSAQLKAFSAGAIYDELLAQHGHAQLSEIRRQTVDWQREASVFLSDGETRAALNLYKDHGRVHVGASDGDTGDSIVSQYFDDLERYGRAEEQLVLAATRDDVAALNASIRDGMTVRGLIGDTIKVGDKEYGVGDQIVFLSNDNTGRFAQTIEGEGLGVKNGTRGVIDGIAHDDQGRVHFEVRLHGVDRTVVIDPAQKSDFFQHGYAVTNHKAQGLTVERSYVLAHPSMREDAAYVAMTRHKTDMHVYASEEQFRDYDHVVEQLARTGGKDIALEYGADYAVSDEFRTLQNYHQLRVETADMMTRLSEEAIQSDIELWEHPEWKSLTEMRNAKMDQAGAIAQDWDRYSRLARQINVTREKIEIDAGLRERPLTAAEKKSVSELQHYSTVTSVVRDQWNAIKKTHPGAQALRHEDFASFAERRDYRNRLASHFLKNASQYGRVMKHTEVSWKMIKSHDQQYKLTLRRSQLNPEERKKFDKAFAYAEAAKAAKQVYATAKRSAEREGVAIQHGSDFEKFKQARSKRDALASGVFKTKGQGYLKELGHKAGEVRQEALMHDLEISAKAYQASTISRDTLKRDASAAQIKAVLQHFDKGKESRAKAILSQHGVQATALVKQAQAHEVRVKVAGSKGLNKIKKNALRTRQTEKDLGPKIDGPSL